MPRPFGFAAVFLTMTSLCGCYTFQGSSLDAIPPGHQARVVLDADGFGRIANQAAMNGITADRLDMTGRGIIGRVVELDPELLTLELRGSGSAAYRVHVPTRSIQMVEQREFSRTRTIAAVAGGAVLFSTLVGSGIVGGSTGVAQPADPDRLLFRVPIRLP